MKRSSTFITILTTAIATSVVTALLTGQLTGGVGAMFGNIHKSLGDAFLLLDVAVRAHSGTDGYTALLTFAGWFLATQLLRVMLRRSSDIQRPTSNLEAILGIFAYLPFASLGIAVVATAFALLDSLVASGDKWVFYLASLGAGVGVWGLIHLTYFLLSRKNSSRMSKWHDTPTGRAIGVGFLVAVATYLALFLSHSVPELVKTFE